MEKITGKRFCAFLIDGLIVSFIAGMFASLSILNPYLDKYNETYIKYMDLYTSQLLGSSESDKKDDVQLESNEENNVIVDEETKKDLSKEEIDEELSRLSYDMTKYGMPTSIIQLVITFLYFVVFQYFNNGKTIGKALLNINVISNDGKLKFSQVFVRSIIINSIATLTLSTSLFYIVNKELYVSLVSYVQLLDLTLLFVSIGMMLFRLDGSGLHDLLANTNVVKIEDGKSKEVSYKEKK